MYRHAFVFQEIDGDKRDRNTCFNSSSNEDDLGTFVYKSVETRCMEAHSKG